jgi:D-alanine--D-alanine ligase
MRITLAFNMRQEDTEDQAELYVEEDVERMRSGLAKLGHEVTPVEVTGTAGEIVQRLVDSRPDLVFNVAEGVEGQAREAYYPALYEALGLAYTGSPASTLHVGLDKRLSGKVLDVRGVRVPQAVMLTPQKPDLPDDLPFPLFVKPNYEGSSKGISQDSVVEDREQAEKVIKELLEQFPAGLIVEQFIRGREFTVPWLEAWPGGILDIVEWEIDHPGDHDIMDFDIKKDEGDKEAVKARCPAHMSPMERQDVLALANRAIDVLRPRDLGRVDVRLTEDGTPYLIELNALPSLRPNYSQMIAARCQSIDHDEVLALVIRSAARRYGLSMTPRPTPRGAVHRERPSARQAGIEVGRFPAGEHNDITDVAGVKVGHVTHVRDDVPDPEGDGTTCIRTGITAVVPLEDKLFNNHLVAGGFILNGIGEMSGLTQAMEWGWLETPILLTNTLSLGAVHGGIVRYMLDRHPQLGRMLSVVIPLIGETDDSFLNDVRVSAITEEDATRAIRCAEGGPIEQGSVGGGTGMISFDFAGGIGSASRVLPREFGGHTIGVLVQSNFGKMRNLTVAGDVVGKQLDPLYPREGRRFIDRGSIVVVVATDAPLLSTQLDRISKRAALGLGRVGSFASSTSGEIVFAFSTGNRTSRENKERIRQLNLSFVNDEHINPLYEATVEATEEAVLNAIFCSAGQTGRRGRTAPAIPTGAVLDMLGLGSADPETGES